MNLNEAKNKLLNIARAELGYHENGNNIIKYADDRWDNNFYGWELQGQPWCDVFVDYCFCKAFGDSAGAAMTYQSLGSGSAACAYSALYYKKHDAFYSYPEVGDQVFFYYNGDINHTGIVETITGSGQSWTSFTTIEGNTSDAVCRRNYIRGNNIIAGFGRPKWELVCEKDTTEAKKEESAPAPMQINFKVGDLVSITDNATYYNSTVTVPDFVKKDNWYIYQIYGDRAVLNENESHTNSIMSPISTSYLKTINKIQEYNQVTLQDEAPQETLESTSKTITYIVKKGDTLWGIASTYLGSGLNYPKIKEANNLKSDIIYVGQKLIIP